MKIENRICPECGNKGFELTNLKNRYDSPYKGFTDNILITVDLDGYQCKSCDNVTLTRSQIRRADEATEESLKQQTAALINGVLNKANLKKVELARDYLRVTPEYISKLLSGNKVPSNLVFITLQAFNENPDLLKYYKAKSA